MPDRSFLQWPFFADTHREFAAALDQWLGEHSEPSEHDESDLDGSCRRLVKSLGAAGWLRACVPAEYGGRGERIDVRTLCLARETLARASGLADFVFAMQGLGGGPITLFGNNDLKARYLPEIARGERIAAFALSEPESGSDVASVRTTARRQPDGSYVLDGIKTWISNAGLADHYVVFARTAETGSRGLSAFVVPADAPGLTVTERIQVSAPHPLGTLRFSECRVPADHRLGEEGDGFKIAMGTLDVFRSTVGAAALGFARRALDEAVARANSRVAFGRPLAEFQLVQSKLASMATDIDASALLVYRAAWTRDCVADRVTREAAMAKWFATEAAQRVVDQSVQLFGALGLVVGTPVERLYREVRALRIYEGTSEIQQLIIAGQITRPSAHPRA
ncbi:MAG: acyl-CoA dehydrogenase family protein [Chloroflexi bacterium]|nr:acyl-CoA dehydrogenase family protein [Chloroflexota bacterium]